MSAARREGQLLLCVTLNAPDDWRDHAALFDYGFETYPRQLLAKGNQTVGLVRTAGSLVPAVPVRTEGEVWYPLTAEERVKAEVRLPEGLEAPAAADLPVGRLTFTLDGAVIGETALVCAAGVHGDRAPKAGPLERLWSLLPWAG